MIRWRARLANLLAASVISGGNIGGIAAAQERQPPCAAAILTRWVPTADQILSVAAKGTGANCAVANVTLTIAAGSGPPLLTFSSAAADLPLIFADARTSATMRAALMRWIAQATGHTTRELPIWAEGQDEPGAGAFHPEPAVTRERYGELRRWAQPTFCFAQGGDKEGCYALDVKKEALTLIGTRDIVTRGQVIKPTITPSLSNESHESRVMRGVKSGSPPAAPAKPVETRVIDRISR